MSVTNFKPIYKWAANLGAYFIGKRKIFNLKLREKIIFENILNLTLFDLGGRSFSLFIVVNVLGHLPNLHNVVLRDGADDPGVVGVPAVKKDLGLGKSFQVPPN